ncbi:MAG: thiamine phosphate synthase [Bacteroidia bacterium]
MKLIVISSSKIIEYETQIIIKLFEAGLNTFHLRKHNTSTRKTKELIKAIPEKYHNRIVIHTHHSLALRFNLKGIHLTQLHKKRKFKTWLIIKLIKLNDPNATISTSFANIGKLFELSPAYKYDYVFLSPIFDSLTSKFQSGFTEKSLAVALAKTNLNVIARGGIDVGIIKKSNTIGFKGLAFYSTIWNKENPIEEFNAIIKKFNSLKLEIE